MLIQKQKNGTGCPQIERVCRYRGFAVLAALVFLCCMCVMPAVATDAYHQVTSAEELKTVIEWSDENSNTSKMFLVVVNSDIAVAGDAWLPEILGNITLMTNSSANNKIYRAVANTTGKTGMFTIGNGGNLTITNNGTQSLTLDGNNTVAEIAAGNNQSLVLVNTGGTFTLAGGMLMNNTVTSSDYACGGGVYVTVVRLR